MRSAGVRSCSGCVSSILLTLMASQSLGLITSHSLQSGAQKHLRDKDRTSFEKWMTGMHSFWCNTKVGSVTACESDAISHFSNYPTPETVHWERPDKVSHALADSKPILSPICSDQHSSVVWCQKDYLTARCSSQPGIRPFSHSLTWSFCKFVFLYLSGGWIQKCMHSKDYIV